jgi:hypothetical protein
VKGKRLFWASIIVVELVLVYVLWKPGRQHFARPAHRTAPAPTLTHEPEAVTATSPVPAPPAVSESKEAKIVRGPVAQVAKPKTPSARPSAPAAKNPLIAMAPHKPSPIPHVTPPARSKPPAVNASLISREPVAVKKLAPPPLSPLESFWCQMSTIDSNCNCKGNDERAANAPMR